MDFLCLFSQYRPKPGIKGKYRKFALLSRGPGPYRPRECNKSPWARRRFSTRLGPAQPGPLSVSQKQKNGFPAGHTKKPLPGGQELQERKSITIEPAQRRRCGCRGGRKKSVFPAWSEVREPGAQAGLCWRGGRRKRRPDAWFSRS